MTRILVIDNYDSFVYTIVGYLRQLGAQTVVVRNDVVADGGPVEDYDGVLVSPGPGTPAEAGSTAQVVRECAQTRTPMLGICLGLQALAEVYGGVITHAPELMHGKTSRVFHTESSVLEGLPSPFTATRYHSLVVDADSVDSAVFNVTARTDSGIIMGLEHRDLPLHGVQFHPESVLTQGGHRLLANWLEMCGNADAVAASAGLAPRVRD